MKSNPLSELSLSRVTLGCMRLHEWGLKQRELLSLIEWCIDNNITTFDHADIYGGYNQNEKLFGNALKLSPSIRNQITLISKVGIVVPQNGINRYFNTERDYIFGQIDKSLAALGVEKIDLLFVHMFDLLADPHTLNETLAELVNTGKVGHIGLSNHSTHEVDLVQATSKLNIVAHQFKVNMLDITNLTNGVMLQCMSKNIHPMIWSPIGGREIFSSKSETVSKINAVLNLVAKEQGHDQLDRVVYQWLLMLPSKPTVVVGSGTRERIENALIALNQNEMSRIQWYRIAAEIGYPFW